MVERLPPDAANPNRFSEAVSRLCKEYNGTHPNWQDNGGDIRSGHFEHLPGKVAPCGLTARHHHGTKTGPDNGHILPGAAAETRVLPRHVHHRGIEHKSDFWQQAHEQFPQRPGFCDFRPSTGANSAPVPCKVAELTGIEVAGSSLRN